MEVMGFTFGIMGMTFGLIGMTIAINATAKLQALESRIDGLDPAWPSSEKP